MISSASPSDPPIPAPMPAWAPVVDDDDVADLPEIEEPCETDDVAAMDVVKVAVVLTVPEAMFVVLRDVEPDVGLNITGPASMENGDVLPLVRLVQLLVAESAWPQQKRLLSFRTYRGYIHCPLVRPTANISRQRKTVKTFVFLGPDFDF